MEIKDFCDIHGEPICVGDIVKIIAGRSNYVASGEVRELTKYEILLVNDKGIYNRYELEPDDTIEIISKYKKEEAVDHSNVLRGHGKYPWGCDKEPDMVNHPPHYQSENGLEVIDVIEAFTADLKGGEATNTGNVIKYILRWAHKENPLQDLKKARWYLDRLIKLVEKRMEKENA